MRVTEFPEKNLKDYIDISDPKVLEEIEEISKKLKGLRVVHVNATNFGGGVAELLYTIVPLMRSVGIDTKWEVMEAPSEFFNITKKLHNALQGAKLKISDDEWESYMKVNKENSKKLELDADIIVIHDPQPAAIPYLSNINSHLIWRCHIDLSSPNEIVWNEFSKFLKTYEKMLFHTEEYFPEDFKEISIEFPPSIDPLSEKNFEMSKKEILEVIKRFSIPNKPTLTVVARFDPWKDLFSAIDVYRMVKKYSDIQLLIVSAMANDDPEGWIFFEKVLRYAGLDDDIKFLTNLIGVGSREVNAIQRYSTLGLHTAIKEGFGLVVSEMMWKGNPVVARPAGGVKMQVDDGENGFLRWDKEELAEAVMDLLKDKEKRTVFGIKGKEKVRRNFLVTSHLLRYLKVFHELIS